MKHTNYRTVERLLSYFQNSQTKAANALGTTRQNIDRWRLAGYIPARWASIVEIKTNQNITAFEVMDTAIFYQDPINQKAKV